MKLKDVLALGVLAVVLIVVGSFMVSKLGRKGQPRRAQVEVVQPIEAQFNQEAVSILLNQNERQKTQRFSPPVNPAEGLGNTNPFAP